MGPIPEDLIVFLLFGLFVLIQIVRARQRKKARRAEPVVAAPAEADEEPAAAVPAPPMPWTPTLIEGPRATPPRVMRASPAPTLHDTTRFSRRRLMGDRRSLQDAIVIATILGPCLAQRPRDTE
jgi:hypothetical protein